MLCAIDRLEKKAARNRPICNAFLDPSRELRPSNGAGPSRTAGADSRRGAPLEQEAFQMLAREQAPRVSREALLRVHPESYVAAIEEAAPAEGFTRIDADTSMSPGTLEAPCARRAAPFSPSMK